MEAGGSMTGDDGMGGDMGFGNSQGSFDVFEGLK
jgi:hypothetical protein